LGISSRTIRIYEEEGFIRVERVANKCLLDPDQVEAIALIERLKTDLGINISGIGVILEMRRKMEDMQARLNQMEREMAQRFEEYTRLEAEFEKRLNQALSKDRRQAHHAVRPGISFAKDDEE
jgi:MerR family transcriptional regulator/heat shock protein HspR